MSDSKRRNRPLEIMDAVAGKLFARSKKLAELEPVYKRHKTFLLYTIFGLGTVIVALISYWLFTEVFHWYFLIGNVVSWFFATAFAFYTNRQYVFTKRARGVYAFFWQLGGFFFGRAITLFIEDWILLFFVGIIHLPNMPVKVAAQLIVIALNWVVSKLIVFRKKVPFRHQK